MSNYMQPKLWSNELNAGNLEPLLKCYAEDAILFATFQTEPLIPLRESVITLQVFYPGMEHMFALMNPLLRTIHSQITLMSAPGFMNFSTVKTERRFDILRDLPMLWKSERLTKSSIITLP